MTRYVAFSVVTLGPTEHRVAIVVAHREDGRVVFDVCEPDCSGEEAAKLAAQYGIGAFISELTEGGDTLAQARRGARWLAEKTAA